MCRPRHPFFALLHGHHGEEGVGEHGERDVAVPAHVAADLVLVQAALVLRALEALLDLPTAAGNTDQVGDGGLQRGAGEVVGDLVGPADAAAGQYPPLPGRLVTVGFGRCGQAGGGPVVEPFALGPADRRCQASGGA